MNYMYSTNANNGQTTITVNFDVKTDPNIDQVLTDLRESQAVSQLPAQVNAAGVTVQKSQHAPLMLIDLYSPKGTYDSTFLANYAYINLTDELNRVPGVARVQIFGAGQYAMRCWVKPDQLAKLGVTVPQIVQAINTQNTVNPAGQIGGEPVPKGQEFTYAVRAQGRLISAEEFGQIVIRANPDGSILRLKDVARIELGAQTYNLAGRFNGKPSAILAIYQLPGSNAVTAAKAVRQRIAQLKQRFPGRPRLSVRSGHHPGSLGRHEGDRAHAVRSAPVGDAGGVYFLAGLACHADSFVGRTRFTGWDVCGFPLAWLFDQYAFASSDSFWQLG